MHGKNLLPCHPAARTCRRSGRGALRPIIEQLEGRQLLSTSVLTYHNDLARTGANLTETVLTHDNVTSATFGKLFSYRVDGYVYAQPLYVPNVTRPDGSVHNIVLVATEHDSVYAFDANNPDRGHGGGLLWYDNFTDPANGITTVPAADTETEDIVPEVGITSTPVIDSSSGILYVVAKTQEIRSDGTHYVQTLHALSITTGNEMFGRPAVIADTLALGEDNYRYVVGSSVPGTGIDSVDGVITFNALRENQRSALALANGVVYVSWASHGDNDPYHGWVIGFDAHTLNPVAIFNDSPNGTQGGIWMAGGAPAVDGNGKLYLAIGNGTFDTTSSLAPGYGDSIVKLDPNTLSVTDYFTPYEQYYLNQNDLDLGSGGVLLLPDSAGSAAHPHLLVQAGKEGKIYLLDRNNLGQLQQSATDGAVQIIANAVQGYVTSTPAYFNNLIYVQGQDDDLKAYQIVDGQINPIPLFETNQVFSRQWGGTVSISANGTQDGIVWILDVRGALSGGPAVLHAYNAADLSQELYNSDQAGSRDVLGNAVKFTVPTIADGEVFIGTQNTLEILGLLGGGAAPNARRGSDAPSWFWTANAAATDSGAPALAWHRLAPSGGIGTTALKRVPTILASESGGSTVGPVEPDKAASNADIGNTANAWSTEDQQSQGWEAADRLFSLFAE